MKNKVIILFLLLIPTFFYGQNKYKANAYFEDFAYKKSAELYEKLYKNENRSDLIIARLADSYYYNSEMEKAEFWYKKLINHSDSKISRERLYLYAQVLRSNGNIKISDSIFKKDFKDSLNTAMNQNLKPINSNYISNFLQHYDTDLIRIKNVKINTEFSDFGGYIHNDKLYFSTSATTNRKKLYKWNEQPYLDLYVASFKDSGNEEVELYDRKKLPKTINTRFHEATLTLTKNGKIMYFTRVNNKGSRGKSSVKHLKLYKAEFVNGKWKKSKQLPFNDDNYSVGHPALSPDEKTLYFISDMPGGYGKTDIYKIDIKADNTFGKPKNLGSDVNTRGREMFPYVGSKEVLYFSTDGRDGLGALDIYETQIEENNGLGEVKNLPAPFNSNLDDFGFVVDSSTKKGFFSSNRKGGKGDDDIYSFNIIKNEASLLSPIVSNIKQDTLQIAFEEIKLKNDNKVDEAVSHTVKHQEENGKQLEKGISSLIKEINADPVYFSFDSYSIRKDAKLALDKVVKIMKDNPEIVIKIESHTDCRGSKAYNKVLSDKRAKATKEYILANGIAAKRIESAIGYGEEKLQHAGTKKDQEKCSDELHQIKRLSYFYIIDTKSKKRNIFDKLEKVAIDESTKNDNFSVSNQAVINPIYFNFNKYNVRDDATKQLEKVVAVMKNNPEIVIKIESHTDSRGSKSYNKILSDKRAKSSKEYMISKGIDAERITSEGLGESQLVNKCSDGVDCTEEEHQLNRRTDFKVVEPI